MVKKIVNVSILAVMFLLFSVNSSFAQCGPDGTQPCNPKPKPKTTVSKSTPPTKKTAIATKPTGDYYENLDSIAW